MPVQPRRWVFLNPRDYGDSLLAITVITVTVLRGDYGDVITVTVYLRDYGYSLLEFSQQRQLPLGDDYGDSLLEF
jgi:hypothetical protein